jgi:ribosomal protein L37AE/L43A
MKRAILLLLTVAACTGRPASWTIAAPTVERYAAVLRSASTETELCLALAPAGGATFEWTRRGTAGRLTGRWQRRAGRLTVALSDTGEAGARFALRCRTIDAGVDTARPAMGIWACELVRGGEVELAGPIYLDVAARGLGVTMDAAGRRSHARCLPSQISRSACAG